MFDNAFDYLYSDWECKFLYKELIQINIASLLDNVFTQLDFKCNTNLHLHGYIS